MPEAEEKNNRTGIEIAVIGMAARFPGAANIHDFWENLQKGRESITFFSDEEVEKPDPQLVNHPYYVRCKGGVLADKYCFDAAFFDYTPAEAGVMDPQIRVFHECCREALEHAGYEAGSYDGLIGIYAGASNHFEWEALSFLSGKREEVGQFAASHLVDKDYLCTRVSYRLDLRGPAVSVQTACSTSLVAIHLACQAILNGECDMALAGGVNVTPRGDNGYIFQEGMIFSPDGHCRPFDAKAKGTIGGSGVGIVVLKLLDDAIKQRDYIHAVIKGSAVNNDGIRRGGFTAPSREGQSESVIVAHQAAEVNPESITYIETHGTGTPLGDPIEVEALKRAFDTDKKGFCALGSVKSNIGHLGAAAGIAGFIKTVLALEHRLIPPSLHFENPNPNIDFENSPFYVNAKLSPWKNNNGNPLRAGVSSFGIGGTNAHVVVEEWPEVRRSDGQRRGGSPCPPLESREYQLILLSAKTEHALEQMTQNLVNYLKEKPGINLGDAAYTLKLGRKHLEHRRIAVCSTAAEAIDALSNRDSFNGRSFHSHREESSIVFMFSGLGAQYVNMGRELYENEPLFRREMDRCFEILRPLMEDDIKEFLYPFFKSDRSDRPDRSDKSDRSDSSDIHQTEITQPLIFSFEYALAKLLMHWGIRPYAMIGYSFGEYTAACISGVFSLEDALKVVVERARLMRQVPEGAMVSVPLSREELAPFIANRNDISLSIDNGPSCIVSGAPDAAAVFEKEMKANRYLCMRLPADRAVHSYMMDPILKAFEDKVRGVRLNPPQIPYLSNVSGKWITVEEAADPGYWAGHLRAPVRFADGLRELVKNPRSLFVEIGPGREVSAMIMRFIENNPHQQVINLVRPRDKEIPDIYYLLNKIGQLWLWGISIDWVGFYESRKEERYRVPLPTYPFEKQVYRIDTALPGVGTERQIQTQEQEKQRKQQKQPDFEEWFAVPSWTRSALLPQLSQTGREQRKKTRWLVFTDECGLAEQIMERLKQESCEPIAVKPGTGEDAAFIKTGETYTINPSRDEDYYRLFDELRAMDRLPEKILHFWGVTGTGEADTAVERPSTDFAWFDRAQDMGFYSLLYLTKAIVRQGHPGVVEIHVVTDSMQEVAQEEILCPEKATVLSPIKVIPQEHPGMICQSIDVVLAAPGRSDAPQRRERLIGQLWREFTHPAASLDRVVVFRDNHRWVQAFEPLRLDEVDEGSLPLKEKGVYLITGGIGKIGMMLARYLAGRFEARLVLTGRSGLSPEEKEKIEKVKKLEALGAEVLVFAADAGNREQMQRVFRETEARFGKFNGVIHAAGITGGKTYNLVKDIEKPECREQFRAKVHGLLILEELLRTYDRPLDFCWLISSLSTVLGGLRFVAYAAGNCFMDAYVNMRSRFRFNDRSWMSIDWDGMDEEKTAAGFQRTLALMKEGVHQVVASNGGNLQDRIENWVKLAALREVEGEADKKKDLSGLKPRPPLMSPYIEPRNDMEQSITGIWQRLFGFERIGVRDDFFELGGDSLKAVTVISRVHQKLNVAIPLTEFFKRVTIADLAEYIAAAEKSAFLEIPAVEKKEYYVLSAAQKRLYLLQEMEKENIGYNETQVVMLEGKVDKEKLAETVRKLIRRHESLRTSIHMVGEEPVQRIHEDVEFEIEYNNLATEAGAFIRPFDLSKAPLLRMGLIHTPSASHRYILVVDRHHMITDGVSHQVFVNEFTALYEGKELPPLRIRYRDYAEWQRSKTRQEALKQQEEYWLGELAGEIPVLELPIDYSRPGLQSFAGHSCRFVLDKEETEALKRFCREQEVTLFMGLVSVFYILLAKLSGQEDIVIGTPTAGRRHADLQYVMGMFVNTLVPRNFPSPGKTFKTFLKEVKQRVLTAFENQDYQFEDLVEQLGDRINRDMGRNPLFDVMFVLQNVEVEQGGEQAVQRAEITDFKVLPFNYERQTAKFDLKLEAAEGYEQIFLLFEYCTKLFKEETIRRFITYFKTLIASVLESPNQLIGEIEILPDEEKKRLLVEFNDTDADYPADKTIHHLFEEQAERSPEGTALVGSGQLAVGKKEKMHVIYRVLNEKADQLAGVLREKGVLADSIVAIMMGRSIEMIIGIMGILKAGAAYLPIDPEYPEERKKYMLADSGAGILLTNLSEGHHFHHSSNQFITHHSGHLLYVIYTSGTTGKPKGCMIDHRNVVRLLFNGRFQFDFNDRDVWTLFHSFCFDFSVWEMYGALLYGGKLVIIPGMAARDTGAFLDILKEEKVTVLNQTPSAFYRLLEEELKEEEEEKLNLRWVIFGGEALAPIKLKEWHARYPGVKLINMFGITETTVHVTYKEIGAGEIEAGIGNIGKPIPTLCVYLLDRGLRLVPVGAAGELCVGGEGVGRGYLNRPELTNKKFLRGPGAVFLKRAPGRRRLYCSGDLARWLPGGDLEYLGRIDHQVKIRGFRIELGEIESRLLMHEKVKDAVVLAKEDIQGDRYLCAFCVPVDGDAAVGELRSYLSRLLPDYMIPSYFVFLAKIPLTVNGKLDRKALPEPGVQPGEKYTAPRDDLEKKLAEIWADVLRHPAIGIDDNFFEIGGHSLKAAVLVSRVHRELAVKLPLVEVFKKPFIREMAAYIRVASKDKYIPVEPTDLKEYYPLAPAQKRLFILQETDRGNMAYNLPQVIPLGNRVDKVRLETAFRKLIARHESLRTSFFVVKDQPVQKVHEEVEFEMEYYRSTAVLPADFFRPFDLSQVPLLRVGIMETETGNYFMMLDMHHIISDRVSEEILIKDFGRFFAGEELPPLKLQYKDYARWLDTEQVKRAVKQQESFWLKEFRGRLPLLRLPTDFERPAVNRMEGDRVPFYVSEQDTGRVKGLALAEGATLYMVILAIYTVFLSKLSGQEDIIVGSPAAGRRHNDLEQIIGMFVGTLAMRNFPSPARTFLEFLRELKTRTLEAFENQDYPYDNLLEKINVPKEPGRTPLFDVFFQFSTFPSSPAAGPGDRERETFTYHITTSKFDLYLYGEERDERLVFSLEYSSQLFKPETIKMFIKNFNEVVSQVAGNAEVKLGDIAISYDLYEKKIEMPETDFAF